MVRSHASEWPPEGFAFGAVGALQLAIAARGAQFLEDIQTSLLHVWTVPAFTNPLGVFAHANPALPCEDGSYVTTHECQIR